MDINPGPDLYGRISSQGILSLINPGWTNFASYTFPSGIPRS